MSRRSNYKRDPDPEKVYSHSLGSDADIAVYDSLPASVRRAIDTATFKYSAVQAREMLVVGGYTPEELIQLIKEDNLCPILRVRYKPASRRRLRRDLRTATCWTRPARPFPSLTS